MPNLNAPILTGLLLYGLFGAAGQVVRAIVALGGSQTLTNSNANQQSLFNAAYFVVTLIVGFVAGLTWQAWSPSIRLRRPSPSRLRSRPWEPAMRAQTSSRKLTPRWAPALRRLEKGQAGPRPWDAASNQGRPVQTASRLAARGQEESYSCGSRRNRPGCVSLTGGEGCPDVEESRARRLAGQSSTPTPAARLVVG